MRRVLPLLVVMLAGCRSDVYRGSDLQKVVLHEHSAVIEQQMTLLKKGQAAEMIRQLGERAFDPAKFEAFRDQAQALLETSLKVGGPVKSYQIVEAEKITNQTDRGPNGKPGTEARPATHDGVIVRLDVQFERASADFEYRFLLSDGIWKSAGLTIKFRAASE